MQVNSLFDQVTTTPKKNSTEAITIPSNDTTPTPNSTNLLNILEAFKDGTPSLEKETHVSKYFNSPKFTPCSSNIFIEKKPLKINDYTRDILGKCSRRDLRIRKDEAIYFKKSAEYRMKVIDYFIENNPEEVESQQENKMEVETLKLRIDHLLKENEELNKELNQKSSYIQTTDSNYSLLEKELRICKNKLFKIESLTNKYLNKHPILKEIKYIINNNNKN